MAVNMVSFLQWWYTYFVVSELYCNVPSHADGVECNDLLFNLGMQVTFRDRTITVTEGETRALVCVQVISGLVERPQPVSVAMGAVENTALGESGMPCTHYANK